MAHARARIDHLVGWLFLAYGAFSVGLEAALTHDEITIATGLETILLSLIDFLWAGQLRSLSIALRLLAVLSPALAYGTSSLFYRDTRLFVSDAFLHSVVLGAVVAIPLWLLAILAGRASSEAGGTDPRWLTALRWAFRAGLALTVLVLRIGVWSGEAIALVYVGAALAITAIALVLPRRVRVGSLGVGGVLLVLGLGALLVIAAAKILVGGHMSGSEAATGAVPAALLAAIGAAVMLTRRKATP